MGIGELRKLVETLPSDSEIRTEFHEVVRYVRRIKDEKTDLNNRNQELLKLLQEEQRRHEDLSYRALINRITGLPNHQKLTVDLEELLGGHRDELDRNPGALIILRLDRSFVGIQSTLKPQMTEWILYQISNRFREMLSDSMSIYHNREDEFAILLRKYNSMKDVMRFARSLRREVKKPHVLSGYNIHLDCHVGVALLPQHGREKGLLLQNADIALQFAEERGKEAVLFYEKLREQVVEKMDLQNSILRALEQQAIDEIGRQFEIYYQPIINLESADDPGELGLDDAGSWNFAQVGAEALIRWHHPQKGTISPDRFIPLAEETGLIIPIGNWVIYNVAAQIRAWKDKGLEVGPVSVNISPRQFHSDTFLHTVRTAMKNNGLSSDSFRFEITETSIAQDPGAMVGTMWDLHREGVYFYIDDFGTGYSSLSYVHQMPVKKIKIDKSFIMNLSRDGRERTIVRTIIAMGKELGLGLVAEGVEHMEHLSYLLGAGVRSFQGYLFSRPLPAERFENYVTKRKYFKTAE